MKIIHRSSLRYIFKHKLQFGLSVLGIAIGVAIIAAIDIANISTSKAFNMSLNSVTGKATHRIISVSGAIPDSVYTFLRIQKRLKNIAPVVENNITIEDSVKRSFVLLGVDLFAEKPFRDYLSSSNINLKGGLKDFMNQKNSVVLSFENSKRLNKYAGDTINASINGIKKKIVLAGVINNYGSPSQLENLIISDISTAQELSGKNGTLDAIDVITDDIVSEEEINKLLPSGYELQRSSARSDIAEQMLSAFNVNLNALSMLALIVGIFLIYNTMTFSVVQRKKVLGIYRSLGVTEGEVYRLIINEVLIVGFIGTALGFVIAIFISKSLLTLISRTINDLYFVVSVTEIEITGFIVIKTFVVGLLASLISSLKPAKEASHAKPGISIVRSNQEIKIINNIFKLSVFGVAVGLSGAFILLLPSKNVWLSYAGVLPVIIGFALLSPLVIKISERLLTPLSGILFGITGKISSRSIIQNISRTNTAIFSLSIAVAATVGVGTMISSFRETVVSWLENGLKADIYVSAPSLISNSNDPNIPYSIKDSIIRMQEIKSINFYSEFKLYQEGNLINILATGFTNPGNKDFKLKGNDDANIINKFLNGEVMITEPYAYKNNISAGDVIKLKTDDGYKDFKVAGIYYDYSSDKGFVSIEYSVFQKYWKSKGLSGIAVYLKSDKDADAVKDKISSLAGNDAELIIRSNKFLRESSIQIFDRTFIVAKVLQLLSVVVAFIGILSALMSLQLERNKEMGVMRAVGLFPSQLFKISTLQSVFMGIISGLLALPLGALLAYILVFIINKRSFGWTMQLSLEPDILLEALALAVVASVLAGIYPGYKISKISPSAALREE